MLVLTRKNDESIIIGDDIKIKVLEIADGRVKIGIDAPRDLKVLRSEVLVTINENKEAGKGLINKNELYEIFKNKK